MPAVTSKAEFNRWLARPGNGNIVCERAYHRFDREKDLPDLCASLASRGGGTLLLGVSREGEGDGLAALEDMYPELSGELFAKLGRIEVEEFMHPQGRVLRPDSAEIEVIRREMAPCSPEWTVPD